MPPWLDPVDRQHSPRADCWFTVFFQRTAFATLILRAPITLWMSPDYKPRHLLSLEPSFAPTLAPLLQPTQPGEPDPLRTCALGRWDAGTLLTGTHL